MFIRRKIMCVYINDGNAVRREGAPHEKLKDVAMIALFGVTVRL